MIVALVALKGGSGKTTLALHLAGEALSRGMRVLIADADPQRSALLLVDRQHKRGGPSPIAIGVTESLPKTVSELAAGYDLTLIDCGPHSSVLTRAALMTADLVLTPIMPSAQDIDSAVASAELIAEARALRPDLQARLVLNRLQSRTAIAQGMAEAVQGFGIPLLEATLAHRVAYADTLASGHTVSSSDAKGAAAREIRALFAEVLALLQSTPARHGKTQKGRSARGSQRVAR